VKSLRAAGQPLLSQVIDYQLEPSTSASLADREAAKRRGTKPLWKAAFGLSWFHLQSALRL
jgi:hypothetical protein